MSNRPAYLTAVHSKNSSNFFGGSSELDGSNSFVYPEPGLAGTPYHQRSSQNMVQAPRCDNKHHAQSGVNIPDYSLTEATIPISKHGRDSLKAPWTSPQTAPFNSHVPPASSIGLSATNQDFTFLSSYEPHDTALWYSGMTYNLHDSLAPNFEGVDYLQELSIPHDTATDASMIPSLFQSNTEPHHLSSHFMPPSFSFPFPNPYATFTHPAFPTSMQPPLYTTTIAHPLQQNDILSACEGSSTILANNLPACLLPGQRNLPQPYAPFPPSTNRSENLQIQIQEARKERLAHRASPYASDRRPTSPPTSPTRLRYRRPQKKQPAVEFEPDIKRLQHRCRAAGADEEAVHLIKTVFVDEVKLPSLTRKLTAKEFASHQFGSESGQVYVGFLRAERDARYTCRLCPRNTDMSWKHRRDALRHLRRDHFGLAEKCQECGKLAYTTGEMSNHRCCKHKSAI